MTKEELLAQAHREAQRRNVPVVQVLVEWLVPRMELLPTAEDVEKLRRSQKSREGWAHIARSLMRNGQALSAENIEIAIDRAEQLGLSTDSSFIDQQKETEPLILGERARAELTRLLGRPPQKSDVYDVIASVADLQLEVRELKAKIKRSQA